MNYQDSLCYLDSFNNFEGKLHQLQQKDFSLNAIKVLLASLGNPEKKLKYVHIAGSKGKGSTTAFTAEILRTAGYRVGLYTSPHLYDIRERIRVLTPEKNTDNELLDGCISRDDFGKSMSIVSKVIDESLKQRLTYFELLTAVMFVYFSSANLDIVVLETGLGGRLDATNVIDPLVCAITRIDKEHTSLLGDTIEKIAGEKAGIIKPGCSGVITCEQELAAVSVIKAHCLRHQVPLVSVGKDIQLTDIIREAEKTFFKITSFSNQYQCCLWGVADFQATNAAVAVGIIEKLREEGFVVFKKHILSVIESFYWPARMEILGRDPMVIADGAHTLFSIKTLLDSIKDRFKNRPLILIFGLSYGKEKREIISALAGDFKAVILTRASHERADPLDDYWIKKVFTDKGALFYQTATVEEALTASLSLASKDGVVLVAGSLFVAAEARKYFLIKGKQ